MLYNVEELLSKVEMTAKEKEKLIQEIKDEFPNDEMLFELHLYRAVKYFAEIQGKKLKKK